MRKHINKITNVSILIIFSLLILSFQCKKNNETETASETETETRETGKLDIGNMKNIIENSDKIDTRIFVAIAIYHKSYISSFDEQTKNMNDEQKSAFFNEKNEEFFKSIKYSEKEYNDYMMKNSSEINDYIISHPEITEYLTSIN